VGRTSRVVAAFSEELMVVGENLAVISVAVGGRGGMEADTEEERVRGVDPVAVGEVVGEAPMVDPTVGQVWRCVVEVWAHTWWGNDSSQG
jgi:hypothetical protein